MHANHRTLAPGRMGLFTFTLPSTSSAHQPGTSEEKFPIPNPPPTPSPLLLAHHLLEEREKKKRKKVCSFAVHFACGGRDQTHVYPRPPQSLPFVRVLLPAYSTVTISLDAEAIELRHEGGVCSNSAPQLFTCQNHGGADSVRGPIRLDRHH